MAASIFNSAETSNATWSLDADGRAAIVIPDSYLLFNADFNRIGSDLILSDDHGQTLRINDYFDAATPADLISPEGAKLDGGVVNLLAGPLYPGQYAQVGADAGPAAIGQVEILELGASVQRADGSVEPLAVGTKVYLNDVVSTVDGGKLSITFVDGTIFTLASNSRMVLNDFIYDPNANDNSAVFNLVEGSFVFIAGSVASTGGMDVKTPVSTIGIRGTTVRVDVTTTNGTATVSVALKRDPDGGLGSITLSDLNGNEIATITSPEDNWVITPTQGGEVEVERRVPDNANDQAILNEAIRAFEAAQQRVEDGGEFVANDDQSDDNEDGQDQVDGEDDGDGEDGDDGAVEEDGTGDPPPPENGEENSGEAPPGDAPPAEQGDADRPPSSGGIESDLTTDPGEIDGGSGTTSGDGFGSDTSTTTDLPPPPPPTTTPVAPIETQPVESGTTEPIVPLQNSSPEINLPTPAPVDEDGSIDLSGFVITDDDNGALTASLTAGSTIRIPSGTGVIFILGSPDVDETNLIVSGTAQQIQDALNMAVYSPSGDADDVGSLTIVIDDGSNAPVIVEYSIPITPQQDPPTALNDALTLGEDSALVSGDVTLNDIDPDVTPVPDVLSVHFASVMVGAVPVELTLGSATILPGGGSFTLSTTGQYSFDPNGAYDSLAAGQTATETINYAINDGHGNTDTATLVITVTGQNDAPVVSAATSPAAVLEGDAGTPSVETFLLSDTFAASDVDAGETPTIDASSVVITANGSSATGVTAPLQVIGTGNATSIELDTQNYDFLAAGQSGIFDVTFDIVSGVDVVSRTIAITVTGQNDAAQVSAATSPASVAEGDAGTVSVESFLLSSTFTGSDADGGETPTVDASSVVITANGSSDTALIAPFQVVGTGNLTRIDVDTQNYDFLGVEGSGVFDVSFNVVSGGETFPRTITITITGDDDPLTVSPATSPTAVPEGDTGTATVVSFLLTDTFTASDPDDDDTPIIDETSVVIAVNGSSDTPLIGPLLVFGTGNSTRIDVDTQNYDFLAAGQLGIFDVTFDIRSGGDVVSRTISITVTGQNDAPVVSAATSPAAVLEGDAGTPSVETFLLSDTFAASDVDAGETPTIDASSVVITANGSSATGVTAPLQVIGTGNATSIELDTQNYDFLAAGQSGIFDVTFDIVSGVDVVSRTIAITVTGQNDAAQVSAATSPASVAEGDAGTVSVESFLLSSTFTGSDADGGETPTVDASSVVITANGSSDTALIAPFQVVGTGNLTRIDVDTQNYDFLGVEGSGVFDVSFNVVSGGETFPRTITITITGDDDPLTVSPATSPTAVPEGDTGTATVVSFLLTDTFTASDPDDDDTPIIDETSVVIAVNGSSDTPLIGPLLVFGTGNSTRIDVDTQNYDFLAAGQLGIFDVTFDIRSGGDVVSRTISITVTGQNDAPIVSVIDPASLDAGIQGTVSEQAIDLNTLLTASDIDQTDTPEIDLSSIVISDSSGTDAPGSASILSVSGSSVIVDTGQFDFLPDGDLALFDVTFDVLSGTDTVSRTITIAINGTDETPINVIEGTANSEVLLGTAGNDYIIGNGNADGGYEFLFGDAGDDVLVGSDESENFDGGAGNDVINTGDNNPNRGDFTQGSQGNDRINFGGNYIGFQIVSYANLSAAVIISLDAAANTGTVDKGVNGTDTLVDILKPLEASQLPNGGGLFILGTEFNDTFNIDLPNDVFFAATGGRGVDTYNIISGAIRLDFRRGEGLNEPDNGIDVNLATGTINDDGFGNTEFITGAGRAREIRGTDFNDMMIGSDFDDSFITRAGDDFVDGGLGFDRIRYDRSGAGSMNIDLQAQSASGMWDGNPFTDTLMSIEWARGSNQGVDFISGSSANERLEGVGGTDLLNGRGGDDDLNGGADADVFIFEPGFGNDRIEDFEFGIDVISFNGFGFVDAAGLLAAATFTFNGSDTQIAFNGTSDILVVKNVDLTPASTLPEDVFTFNAITAAIGGGILNGTSTNDFITGSDQTDEIMAGDGNDVIVGNGNATGGFELLHGGNGNDILIGSDERESFNGGDGNDIIHTGDNDPGNGDYTQGSRGDDQINFSGNYAGYQEVSYGDLSAAIIVDLNSAANTGSVDKGVNGTDTLIDILKPLQTENGGMGIIGTEFNDTFNIDLANVGFFQVVGGRGIDSYNIISGEIRLDFRRDENFNQPDNGIDINLATGTVNDDGFGNTEFITGAGRAREVRGTDFDDMMIGSDFDDSFITRAGDDFVDGGLGFDRIRYDRNGAGSMNIDLQAQTATGTWDGNLFTDTLIGIERVQGSDANDIITGTSDADELFGEGGNDTIIGNGNTNGGFEYLSGGDGDDTLIGSDDRESFNGGDGNDVIQTGDNNPNNGDYTEGSRGNDIIDFSGNLLGYQTVSYGELSAAVVVSLNSTLNTGTVNKGVNGTDTLIDILKPLQSADGGMGVEGTAFNDTFNIDLAGIGFFQVTGGHGIDSYNIISGEIRLDFRRDENFNQPDNGIDINLATNTINDDGFGNTEFIIGAGRVREVRGTDFDDMMIGSDFDDSFVTRAGNDTVNGGLGFDRVRYDRNGAGDINIDLQAQSATGTWDGNAFTDTLISIEYVRGGDGADTMLGTMAAERFDGRDGNDVLEGGGGLDDFFGNNDDDTVIVADLDFNYADGGSGQDSLVFQGGGQTIDFTLNSGPDTVSFERIDLGTGDGITTLIGNEQNIIDASDEANAAIAAVLGNGDDALLIDGDLNDFLNLQSTGDILGGGWQLDVTDSGNYAGYNVYDYTAGLTTFARVAVDEDIAVTLPAV